MQNAFSLHIKVKDMEHLTKASLYYAFVQFITYNFTLYTL